MDEEIVPDLIEFSLANAIYAALVEGHAAEISARRTAMENASKVRWFALMALLAFSGLDTDYRSPDVS